MFSINQLSEDQKAALHRWAAEGATIADLQKRLKEEFELGMTYMDARFMVLDLGLEIQQEEQESKPESEAESPTSAVSGSVQVSLDSIAHPGALISGKVVFSDGETGIWMLDQQGRPSLDPDTTGYRPSEEDVMEFQKQLGDLVKKQRGM